MNFNEKDLDLFLKNSNTVLKEVSLTKFIGGKTYAESTSVYSKYIKPIPKDQRVILWEDFDGENQDHVNALKLS